MRKNIIYILVIVAVALAVYFFQKNDKGSQQIIPNRNETTGQTAEVDYSDSGYAPAIIRVKAGTTVNFVNNSSNLMWTASHPHPTHTGLPEFDALKGLPKDQTYSFTFQKTGTWRYHNHLSPAHAGSIVVE